MEYGMRKRPGWLMNIARRAFVIFGLSFPIATPAFSNGPTAPQIGEIQWYQADSYCSFFRKGHNFSHDKPESWRFVFMTNLVSDTRVSVERGYARIDNVLRELELLSRESSDEGEKRIYRTFGDNPVTLTIRMKAGEKGSEHTNYSGTIAAKGKGGISVVAFAGDCGT